jgi:predicted RNase H-like HicB family nuclease
LHTQGNGIDDALANASEAVALYVEGLRKDGRSLDTRVVRHRVSLLARDRPGGDEIRRRLT